MANEWRRSCEPDVGEIALFLARVSRMGQSWLTDGAALIQNLLHVIKSCMDVLRHCASALT